MQILKVFLVFVSSFMSSLIAWLSMISNINLAFSSLHWQEVFFEMMNPDGFVILKIISYNSNMYVGV